MQTWSLSLRAAPESGLPSVDVVVGAQEGARVADLARAVGGHVAPDQPHLLLVPLEGGVPWPADRPLAECGLRTGDLLDVAAAPPAWLDRPGAATRPRAVLRVVDGPDRGLRVGVHGAAAVIGRARTATLRLSDPLVSGRHVTVTLGTRPVVSDAGSAHGTRVAGDRLRGGREVDWGTTLQLGRTTVAVEAGDLPTDTDAVSVYRAPRFGQPLVDDVLDIPAPPSPVRPSPLPWAMLALPMIMGAAMFGRTQTAYALVYMLAWPVLGYAGWWQQRRAARKQFDEDVRAWRTDVDEVLTRLDDQARAQRAQQHEDHPEPGVVRERAQRRDPLLWARASDRDAWLHVRLGIGAVEARLRARVSEGGDRDTRRVAVREAEARDELTDMPVLADLTAHRLVALTGAPDAVDGLTRSVLLRLAFDHAPADLSVAACLGTGRRHHETWLRWLPHATARVGGEPPVALGPTAATALLERLAAEEPGRGHTVCVVDEAAGIPRRTVEAVAGVAAERGLHLLWLGEHRDEVPAATGLAVDLRTDGTGTVAVGDRGGESGLARPDDVDLDHAWRTARSLTGLVDEAAVLPPSTALPAVVRLPEVSSDLDDLDDAGAVVQRWARSAGLRAQIGVGVDGVVTVDLREDGPHGLVAGTTGSGKSELLQSLICSLALNNPPSRISFLLVDYKGGAAFRECADLPHTVGYITDLTPALVTRALTSLGAEISAREELLATHGVKDLVQLEREQPGLAPPSLLICVDEFAALSAEVPQFVDGMVSIAQRGRSLGLHVVLATQRPQGVVTGDIRANTDLRIALRVSSDDDSRDVVDSPEASRISRRTPGRAWIRRTGHGTAELVQSAWTGARETLADDRSAVTVRPLTAVAGGPSGPGGGAAGRLAATTDLERCVTTIRAAATAAAVPAPPRPWLPPLPTELLLDVPTLTREAAGRPGGRVHLGRVDEPSRQRQPALEVDLAAVGHLLVHGASGSGKTELLRTAALTASLGDAYAAGGVAPYLYGLDFAGGGLAPVADLPTVEAVVGEAQLGRALRLIRLLRRTAEERTAALAARGCSDLADLARAGHPLPRVYVLLDNLPALVERLEGTGGVAREHVDHLQQVLQNGRRVGIHVLATAPGRGGVPTAIGASFGRRVVLRMTNPDDYLMLGVPADDLDAESAPGSGLLHRARVQVATTGGAGTPLQAERVAAVADLLAPLVAGRGGAPVPPMPTRLDPAILPAPVRDAVCLAVDAEAVAPVVPHLLRGPVLVCGRASSGRSEALAGVASVVARGEDPPYVVRVAGALELPSAAADLQGWLARRAAGEAECSWSLLLVDDADLCDTAAGADGELREARDLLVGLVEAHREVVASVMTAETGVARQRGATEGLLHHARAARRGVLLAPEWGDGDVMGVTVPTKTTEPLTGPGRGLWCEAGTAWVAQLVAAPPVAAAAPGVGA